MAHRTLSRVGDEIHSCDKGRRACFGDCNNTIIINKMTNSFLELTVRQCSGVHVQVH